jgi:hypothetical protein
MDPTNIAAAGLGAGLKINALHRVSGMMNLPAKYVGRGATAVANFTKAAESGMARGIQRATGGQVMADGKIIGGMTPNLQTSAALGAAGATAYFTGNNSPASQSLSAALAILPAIRLGGGILRKVGTASDAGWAITKELNAGPMGAVNAEVAQNLVAGGKIPERFARHMRGNGAASADSTLRRVAQNVDNPAGLRTAAQFADNVGVTKAIRALDDTVGGAAMGAGVASPFALIAPDPETAGGIIGGGMAFGAGGGLVAGKVGRMAEMTDANIARMLVDAESAGGNAALLATQAYGDLAVMAGMQAFSRGKLKFLPLSATEYRANVDTRGGGESTAGLFVERSAEDGSARVLINMGEPASISGRVRVRDAANGGKSIEVRDANGNSVFSFVPDGRRVLVKSGDMVEAGTPLTRATPGRMSLPEEIGHAIFSSEVMDGVPRDEMRNYVNQRYGTDGILARGREYAGRIVDAEVAAGAYRGQVGPNGPDAAGREALIEAKMDEWGQDSISKGGDALDWARDEVIGATVRAATGGLDLVRLRNQSNFSRLAEHVVQASSRVLKVLGVDVDSAGRVVDPAGTFRDNPVFSDPAMRRMVTKYMRNYDQWLAGIEVAGAKEKKGVRVAPSGRPEDMARSAHSGMRDRGNGYLENDVIVQTPDGKVKPKKQAEVNKAETGRAAQIGTLWDRKKVLPANSTEFGRRVVNGRETVGGPVLPPQFDLFTHFPKHIREFARMLESGRQRGLSWIADYNAIGSGSSGRYNVSNLGNIAAIIREVVPVGWQVTKANHLLATVFDMNAFRAATTRAINEGKLGAFNNDMSEVNAALLIYLDNHKNGRPGETGIGGEKKALLNGLIGTGTAVQQVANPFYTSLNPRGSVRTFRVDRLNSLVESGREGLHLDYEAIKSNRMPGEVPPQAQGMPDAPRAMPDDTGKIRAFRGTSRSKQFNDGETTWLTTSRDAAESYAKEVFGYEDPVVLEVLVDPKDIPTHDIRKLSEDQLNALEPDEFGNPQKIGIYHNSDDSMLGGNGAGTVMHVPKSKIKVVGEVGGSNPKSPDVRFMPDVALAKPPKWAKNAPIKDAGQRIENQQIIKNSSSLAKNAIEIAPQELFGRIDAARARIADDPLRLADPRGYLEYLRDAGVWGDVLFAPPTLKTIIESPAAYVENLLGAYHGDKTKAGIMEAADAGLDATVKMRNAIGERPPVFVTALHHLWGILSRMLAPVEQESGWLRLISSDKILGQIQKSIDGTYDLDSKQWSALVQSELKKTNEISKGRGNNATANANAFHLMLSRWNGSWDRVSDVYSAPTALESGRKFWALGMGPVGIKNKVQRFIGLTYGTPGLIMDRWKFVEFYYPQFGKKPQDYFRYTATGTPEDPMSIYGHYGNIEGGNPNFSLAFYEGIETALQKTIESSSELQQVLGRHANVGGMHWKGWNAIKNEAVGHSSLDLTYDLVKANPNPTPETLLQLLGNKQYYTEGLVGHTMHRFTLPLRK